MGHKITSSVDTSLESRNCLSPREIHEIGKLWICPKLTSTIWHDAGLNLDHTAVWSKLEIMQSYTPCLESSFNEAFWEEGNKKLLWNASYFQAWHMLLTSQKADEIGIARHSSYCLGIEILPFLNYVDKRSFWDCWKYCQQVMVVFCMFEWIHAFRRLKQGFKPFNDAALHHKTKFHKLGELNFPHH